MIQKILRNIPIMVTAIALMCSLEEAKAEDQNAAPACDRNALKQCLQDAASNNCGDFNQNMNAQAMATWLTCMKRIDDTVNSCVKSKGGCRADCTPGEGDGNWKEFCKD
jgi:hypothetical protein